MPTQREVKEETEVWWICPEQLIKTVRFWKMKDHLSLRGIRFSDIPDKESEPAMSESEKRQKRK